MTAVTTAILGILGIILGAIWIGVGMKAGEALYETVLNDWWLRSLDRFRFWIKHFKKAPGAIAVRVRDSVRKDIDRLP